MRTKMPQAEKEGDFSSSAPLVNGPFNLLGATLHNGGIISRRGVPRRVRKSFTLYFSETSSTDPETTKNISCPFSARNKRSQMVTPRAVLQGNLRHGTDIPPGPAENKNKIFVNK
jgi:hypothetical protein